MRRWWWTRPAPCRRAAREMQRYLDDESDPDAAWRVARHLSRCEECFSDAEALRQLKDELARLRVTPDPDALVRLRRLIARLADPAAGA